MTQTGSAKAVIESVYEAFNRGDIPFIITQIAASSRGVTTCPEPI